MNRYKSFQFIKNYDYWKEFHNYLNYNTLFFNKNKVTLLIDDMIKIIFEYLFSFQFKKDFDFSKFYLSYYDDDDNDDSSDSDNDDFQSESKWRLPGKFQKIGRLSFDNYFDESNFNVYTLPLKTNCDQKQYQFQIVKIYHTKRNYLEPGMGIDYEYNFLIPSNYIFDKLIKLFINKSKYINNDNDEELKSFENSYWNNISNDGGVKKIGGKLLYKEYIEFEIYFSTWIFQFFSDISHALFDHKNENTPDFLNDNVFHEKQESKFRIIHDQITCDSPFTKYNFYIRWKDYKTGIYIDNCQFQLKIYNSSTFHQFFTIRIESYENKIAIIHYFFAGFTYVNHITSMIFYLLSRTDEQLKYFSPLDSQHLRGLILQHIRYIDPQESCIEEYDFITCGLTAPIVEKTICIFNLANFEDK
jgi:hypothetical protein